MSSLSAQRDRNDPRRSARPTRHDAGELRSPTRSHAAPGDAPATSTPNESRPARVLLADDDDEMRSFLADVCDREGCEVTQCKDGAHLLKLLRLSSDSEDGAAYYDLIISDMRMPEVGGMEILEAIRNRSTRIPMILITAFGDDGTHAQARHLGAVTTMDKPFDIEDLLAIIRQVLTADSPYGQSHPPSSE